jgi:beta-1,4-glucosyltransferase
MTSKHLVSVGGFQVRESTTPAVLRFLERVLETGLQRYVFFANHNFVLRCHALRETIVSDERAVVFNDGVGMDVAAMLLRGSRFGHNLNGTDLVPAFLRDIHRPIRVYLLGSTDAAVRSAARKFSRLPNVQVVGWCDGFSLWHGTDFVLDHIHRCSPDVLLVAMGNPIQEKWILENGSRLRAPLIMGVGALFEWASGEKTRSPEILRKLRLEWLYRMALEPRRLFRRYTIDYLRFLLIVLRERRRRSTPSAAFNDRGFPGQVAGGVRGR